MSNPFFFWKINRLEPHVSILQYIEKYIMLHTFDKINK